MHFSTDTNLEPDIVHVSQQAGGMFEAHLGMLRNHHTYSADIPVSHSLGGNISAAHSPLNIHVTVTAVPETSEVKGGKCKYHSLLKVQVKAIKEGDISEKIRIYNDDDEQGGMEIVVTAKVLRTNQGNPLLKTGIHMISHQHSEESDFTEWPGSKVSDDDD